MLPDAAVYMADHTPSTHPPLPSALPQPLTPILHLSDMRLSVPGYTEYVAHVLKALVLALQDLVRFYTPYTSGNYIQTLVKDSLRVVPHVLRNRWAALLVAPWAGHLEKACSKQRPLLRFSPSSV